MARGLRATRKHIAAATRGATVSEISSRAMDERSLPGWVASQAALQAANPTAAATSHQNLRSCASLVAARGCSDILFRA